jgi:DNA helicase II / ATP-dependent DNA helicase PcrA
MDKEFVKAYKQLNTRQRQAVDAIEGPVLVVAGPGTGKTQLLSLRVANILQKTDSDASNILCLTFTNKAALNMRQRLQQLIGLPARNVNVRTFHSFAAEIMNTYPDNFWEGARLSVAPDAVQLEIIQSILAGLPLDNPLASTFAGAFTALGDVQNALKLSKEAGLTPDELRDIIAKNTAYVDSVEADLVELLSAPLSAKKLPQLQTGIQSLQPQKLAEDSLLLPLDVVIKDSLDTAIAQDTDSGKTKHTGKWKARWIQTVDGKKGMVAERKRNAWWLAVADVYEAYREQLHQRGYYDYSDMLIEVLQQLEAIPDMRADLQERYLYVLIDEFQDTNAAQLRLAHLISDSYAANGKPNLMAVGDDDQSIFAFNGAELNNMLSFRRSYPATQLVILEDNYRSSQAILDTAQTIITQAEDRLVKREPGLTKNLLAQTNPKHNGEIAHISYPTRLHQQSAVARDIKQSWLAGEASIAVLARTHSSLKQLAAILLAQDVPVRYEQQSNVLEHEAVKQLHLLARIVVAIADGNKAAVNVGLGRLLRHPMWELSDRSLWKLAISNYSSPDWLDGLLTHDDERLNAIGQWLIWLARTSYEQSASLTIEHLIGLVESPQLRSPFREFYLSRRPVTSEYLETLSAIEILCGSAREFASGSQTTLADFVRFIELNLSTKRIIADESWFMSDERAVELLTIHKVKGLEYDMVYVIDAIESSWQPRAGSRKSPANLQLQSYGESYDDYVRLLYVAATRAKHSLKVTSYNHDDRGNKLLPTPLIASLPLTEITEPGEDPIVVLEEDLRWPRLETTDERALLKDRLERMYISATGLIDFLNVAEAGPQSFMERHILRLPVARSPKGSYGTAIHAALETAQRLINTGKLEFGTVLDRFEAALIAEHLAPIDYEQYYHLGKQLLQTLIVDERLHLQKGALTEQQLEDVELNGARLGGRIDRIDIVDGQLTISDYKTGKALSSFDTKDQTKLVKAWRHRLQLLFYCLMTQHSGRFKAANIDAQMLYVEAEKDNQITLKLQPDAVSLERLERLVTIVWQRIQTLDFPDTSKYSADLAGITAFEDDLLSGSI